MHTEIQPPDGGALRPRTTIPRLAVMVGDRVGGEEVTGFSFAPTLPSRGYPLPDNDRLLLECDGDDLPAPPERPVPLPVDSDAVERCGQTPLEHLAPERVHPAATVGGHLEQAFERLVFGQPPASRFYAELTAQVERTGHQMWIAGGAVRDLVDGGQGTTVKDTDFSGTVPLGLMSNLAARALATAGVSDARPKVSGGMVCSVQLPGRKERMFEYKPLALKRYRFPAFGGELPADAATRDLTVNTLLYDLRDRQVLDPLARGLADLRARPRVLAVPYAHADPVERLTIVLRAIKFVVRWEDEGVPLLLDELRAWLAALPDGLIAQVPAEHWSFISTAHRFTLGGVPAGRQRAAAAGLGAIAADLIAVLDTRRSR